MQFYIFFTVASHIIKQGFPLSSEGAKRYISEPIHLSQSLKLHQEWPSTFSLFPVRKLRIQRNYSTLNNKAVLLLWDPTCLLTNDISSGICPLLYIWSYFITCYFGAQNSLVLVVLLRWCRECCWFSNNASLE